MSLKAFIYQEELYIRTVPSKALFKSTMVHEVVNRGDVFALRVSDQQLTIIPGAAQVEHIEYYLSPRFRKSKDTANSKQISLI